MAHFAKLNENNVVLEVHVVNTDILLDNQGIEREELGISFLIQWSKGYPYWKQTSYNGKFRKHFASTGYIYNDKLDAFIPPQPFKSWSLNEETCLWEPPVVMPTEGGPYQWNEDILNWEKIKLE